MPNDNTRIYAPGETVFKEGEKGDLMYILLEGVIELRKKVERGETVLKTVQTPNEFFGEMALLDDRPRSASAIAVTKARLLVVDGPSFETMILTNGRFALTIIKVLSERIRKSNDQVSELIETMPRERIARGMIDFALSYGESIHDGAIKVNLDAMKKWINTHLGIPLDEIESAVFHMLKAEAVAWAPTSVKTRESLMLPEAFIKANDRRYLI